MRTLILLAALLVCVPVQACEFVVHTFTYHAGGEKLETFTPGLGYTTNSSYSFGALRNSFKSSSIYIVKMFPIFKGVRVGMGAITGYYHKGGRVGKDEDGVIPLLAAEIDITKNVSVIWFGNAFNLTLKF